MFRCWVFTHDHCAPHLFPDRTQFRWFEDMIQPSIDGAVYAERMDIISRISKALYEITRLARILFTNGVHFIVLCARSRTALAAENLFLRKQLAFYQERKVAPRRFDNVSRFVLVLLSHWFAWKDALVNVTPKTFIGWHRTGFRLFWRWKSRPGRPPIPAELRALIREMARDNPGWGEERIANELLLKLEIQISPRTVGKYMSKRLRGRKRLVPTTDRVFGVVRLRQGYVAVAGRGGAGLPLRRWVITSAM